MLKDTLLVIKFLRNIDGSISTIAFFLHIMFLLDATWTYWNLFFLTAIGYIIAGMLTVVFYG